MTVLMCVDSVDMAKGGFFIWSSTAPDDGVDRVLTCVDSVLTCVDSVDVTPENG